MQFQMFLQQLIPAMEFGTALMTPLAVLLAILYSCDGGNLRKTFRKAAYWGFWGSVFIMAAKQGTRNAVSREGFEGLMAFYDPNIVFEKAVIHTLALGYFITVLIGFGTRVILGHSGSTPHANKFAIFIFIFVQIVVLFRIFTSFSLNFELNYITLLNLTAILLIFGLLLWSSKYITILLKGK